MSMRMAASCGQARQERSLPRGARISRVVMSTLPRRGWHLARCYFDAGHRRCRGLARYTWRGCLSGPTEPGSVPPMTVGTSPYDTDGAGGVATEPIRVLIADDEPALRGALADLLEHEED